MPLFTFARSRSSIMALIAATGSLGLCPASAQDSALRVLAKPTVLYSGQSADVRVLADFPAGHYAFASAQFSVCSSHPAWTFASGGGLIAPNMFSVWAAQQHRPQTGVFADPANPYLVWNGVLTPTSSAPSLVQIDALPTAFSVYPSPHSPSAVQLPAASGTDYLMVNPLRAGRWLAAAGAGNAISVASGGGTGDDVIVDGRIITGGNPEAAILIGLLLPAVQNVRESASRVNFDGFPDHFRASVQVERDAYPIETHSFNFGRVELNDGSRGMSLTAHASSGAPATFGGFLGGVHVATVELAPPSPNIPPAIITPSVAPRSSVKLVHGGGGRVQWTLEFDAPVRALFRGRDARMYPVTIDSIQMSAPVVPASPNAASQNNLRQIGLGMHTYEATGTRGLRVVPDQPR